MQKAHDASKNAWWRNYPNVSTPIVQDELNRIESTIDIIDDRVVEMDTTKANQSDMLTVFYNVTLDEDTGVFTFYRKNGTTVTIDTLLEKIITNWYFDNDPTSAHYQQMVLTLKDGTVQYIDLSAFVTQFEFVDSATIHWVVNNNGEVVANIINGSVTEDKLQPNFLADCRAAKTAAETAETNAETAESGALGYKREAEAWAVGTKDGVPVTPTDLQYHNSAYYWAQQARAIVGDKVDSFNGRIGTVVAEDGDYPSDYIVPETGAIPGQVPVVRNVGTGQDVKLRYVNEDLDIGLKPHIIVISETGSTVTLTKGTKVIYASETSPEHFEADVTEFGTWVIDSVLGGDDAQVSLVVDTVKIYTVDDSHWHADITVTYPTGGTCSCSKSGTTTLYATGSPYTFTVHESGTYTITATANGETYTDTVEVTTSGQTETLTIPNGSTVTPTDDVPTLIACAGIGNSEITTVSGLLADTTTLLAVINSTNAIDYLVRSTTFASSVTADSTAMSYIGLNNYASNTLLADSDWLTAIANSAYIESVMNIKVPTMTSDTTPSGTAVSNGTLSASYPAYQAFDGNLNTVWASTAGTRNDILGYIRPSAFVCKVVRLNAFSTNVSAVGSDWTIYGSNDATDATSGNWTQLGTSPYHASATEENTVLSSNTDSYKAYRIVIRPTSGTGSYYVAVKELQFYGREDV